MPLSRIALISDFSSFFGVHIENLLELASAGRWIQEDTNGSLILTAEGEELLSVGDPTQQLRKQIKTLMNVLSPSWAFMIAQGRKAFIDYAPGEVVQCFREAEILDTTEPEIIAWLDSLASRYREKRELSHVIVGRRGERLSFRYEFERTGKKPDWVALDYEGYGYDLLSYFSADSDERLLIEVKASENGWENAEFYLTRYEWETLRVEDNKSVLHLWSLHSDSNYLAVVSIPELCNQIPLDKGNGRWDKMKCPFSVFKSSRSFT